MFKIHLRQKSIKVLNKNFFEAKINFDLQDRDRILRVAGIPNANIQVIILNVKRLGYQCQVLD